MDFLKNLDLPTGTTALVAIAVAVFFFWKLLIPALVLTSVVALGMMYLAVKEPDKFEKVKLCVASAFNAGLGAVSFFFI